MTDHDRINETIVEFIKCNKDKWYDAFNKLDKTKRHKIIKSIYSEYANSILDQVTLLDSNIHIINLGTISIKPSRKQFLDLVKSGVDAKEAASIVKSSYRELNGKTKNIL